jgi:hypothetical protein
MVKRRVMQLAQCNSIWNYGLAVRIRIGEDVRSVQQLLVP